VNWLGRANGMHFDSQLVGWRTVQPAGTEGGGPWTSDREYWWRPLWAP
jgi:hypothetical protein